VLQGFNGNLTMLDSKGSGGGSNESYSQSSGGSNFGQVPSGNAAPATSPELDDEIPF